MTERVVKTQSELDQAIADKVGWIEIRSEAGVWIEVRSTGSSTVTATGSSTVTAYDSSTVRATGSSTVTATGSSTVTASDSSTVTATDSSTVTATGSSTVRATGHVAVHLHSGRVCLDGGVVIDHTAVDQKDAATWCEYHAVAVTDGIATVYKAVDDQWTTDRGTIYSPGSLPSCTDFVADHDCGGGLHFGPTPVHALAYHPEATRFVAVGIRVDEMNTIPGTHGDTAKCKAPRVVVACVEVDINGRAVTPSGELVAVAE